MTEFFKLAAAVAAIASGIILLIPVVGYMANGMYDTYNGYGGDIFFCFLAGISLLAAGATFLWMRSRWYKQ